MAMKAICDQREPAVSEQKEPVVDNEVARRPVVIWGTSCIRTEGAGCRQ